MTAGVRFSDPLKKAIIIERLLSALNSAQAVQRYLTSVACPDGADVCHTLSSLCHMRAFTLVRDFLDPRPAPRYPSQLCSYSQRNLDATLSIRSWRRRFPGLEMQ